MRFRLCLLLSALCLTTLLAGCGGGGGDEDGGGGGSLSKPTFTRVVTIGDSLADVGTFGLKFTIRNAESGAWYPVYPELVAADVGSTQCPYHRATAMNAYTTDAACTNFAVGGGRVMNTAGQGGSTAPQHIPRQLATAAGVVGRYRPTDLVLIDGGGNDVADLVAAFLSDVNVLRAFLLRGVDAATLDPLLAQQGGAATAGGLYMEHLADAMFGSIQRDALDQGATHVAVLDIPDITRTPRLQALIADVASRWGADAALELRSATRQWIQAYNNRLHARAGLDARVVVVPLHDELTAQWDFPALYGLTNVTQAACPPTGVEPNGLPTYDFQTCSSAWLDAAPPQGLSAGWWHTWAFSDGFHPTPRGHEMLAGTVQRALAAAGW